ncbi:aminopeptidase O isoform X1 [Xiphophorus couchianus]|uniref:aminopeptidase O isoform X1 n=1 Tax=Xiphophorus couchianus TaxID=32473 RepID=UPI00101634E7|nr:aminopeptidase O isoform X1 [Xiphophorus couchianus]XP_027889692.1 aminopeptidase O isoform X1 [Xiphophorus couchianus]XP_027889693.1 aminopeptidase O isoform X1 [Xiphophorus couchianus]
MEPDGELNPDTDDLPLRANTNHILVRHYVLDLTVCFDKKIISGSIVLFLEPCSAEIAKTKDDIGPETGDGARQEPNEEGTKLGSDTQSSDLFHSSNAEDFTLVLDCCDLEVSKVEEVDTNSVSAALGFPLTAASEDISLDSQADFIQHLFSMPSSNWKEKHRRFLLCSRSPGVQNSNSLHFHTDHWSLKLKKMGVTTSQGFPRIIRIYYMTRPLGGSVRWTKDQDNRECVYTAGSPINNRALFPCQEPPVAMSTWQARVRAPSDCVVLMSGEDEAVPAEDGDTHFLSWNYYVTMPMPASTFTLAVGHWCQVPTETPSALENEVEDEVGCSCLKTELGSELTRSPGEVVRGAPCQIGRDEATSSDSAFCHSSLGHKELSLTDYSGMEDDGISCSHGDYPCRFAERSAWSQRVVPHRVFSPACLLQKAQMGILKLLPQCLAAAHAVLGVHPFPRLDVLIVPAGFSSLGMASPHIIFLSQSVLCKECPGSGLNRLTLSGSRICHEIAHSWFGLVIGARDWTEEWISEGFATFLEDIIWAQAQQLSSQQTAEQFDLKALLRWRRLSDELQNSNEELQILRPNMERTGQVSDSGSSTIKHALNPDKTFMQVHYLKGYFLLRFLASEVGDQHLIDFFRLFVKKYHGQLVLSQDFLQMFLITFPHIERKGLTLSAIYADWLDRPGIPEWLHERSAVWSQARLVEEVKAEVVKWILSSRTHQAKGRKRKRTEPKVNYKELTTEQLVMLLELLLEESELSVPSMRALHKTYNLQNQDAEVRHRWCELVVKHTYSQAYCDVEDFLLHDQAMGVYLYGELMVQEDPEQQALARRCLGLVQEEMDQSARRVVEEMIL